jgi:hypothetical protein
MKNATDYRIYAERVAREATDEGLEIGPCDVCEGSGWIIDQPDENEENWKQVDCPSDCWIGRDGDRIALYRVTQTEGE